jgi:hypothetical protein
MTQQDLKQEQFDFQCASPPLTNYQTYNNNYSYQQTNYYLSTPNQNYQNQFYSEMYPNYFYNDHYNQNVSFNSCSPSSYYSSSDNSYSYTNNYLTNSPQTELSYQSSENLAHPQQTSLTEISNIYLNNNNYSPIHTETQITESKKRPTDDSENQLNEPEVKYTQYRRPAKRPTVARMANLEVQSVRCTFCSLEFENVAKRLMHENKHHREGKANQCPICSKFFAIA